MLLLGLTGNIACGKSTVTRLLQERGAAILDADLLVRELYADGQFASQVAQIFPSVEVLDETGQVERARLGAHVFRNAEALRQLEALVHPAVADLRATKLEDLRASGTRVVALEAVKLIESGQADVCHQVWRVTCAPDVQMHRLRTTRGLSEEQASARLSAMPAWEPQAARLERVGVPYVMIDNSGTFQELQAQVITAWEALVEPD